MLPFRKVLFPIDYSQPCDAVVPYVADMVSHFNAELTLLHGYQPHNPDYAELIPIDVNWTQRIQAFEEERLKKFACRAFPSLRAELIAESGEPEVVIHNVLKHQGADLIMMPTRGEGALRRLLFGSTTAKVLHDVDAAVWTGVGPSFKKDPMAADYQSILCAVDDTEETEAVIRAAAMLANSYEAQLFFVHAVVIPTTSMEADFSCYRKEIIEIADFRLSELKAKLNIKAAHLVTDALLTDTIQEQAKLRKANLLVLGRGAARRSIGRIWSNLYSLIRESSCPVLSI